MSPHGTVSRYSHGCRCVDCRRANRVYKRQWRGAPAATDDQHRQLDAPWLLADFPVAIVARQQFPDDDVAIARAFGAAT